MMRHWVFVMNENQFNQILEKLDILTKAIAIFTIKDLEDRKDKIWILHAMGISNSEIAEIFNTTTSAIAMTLSRKRTSKSKEKGDEKAE